MFLALLKYVTWYMALIPGSATATMFLLRLSGCVGYHYRSGPGSYEGIPLQGFFTRLAAGEEGRILTLADAAREAEFLLAWFGVTLPAALIVAVALFFLVHLMRMFGLSSRGVTVTAAVCSTVISTYLVFAFGWYLMMDYAVVLVGIVAGFIYGAVLLPRYQPREILPPLGSDT